MEWLCCSELATVQRILCELDQEGVHVRCICDHPEFDAVCWTLAVHQVGLLVLQMQELGGQHDEWLGDDTSSSQTFSYDLVLSVTDDRIFLGCKMLVLY
jgi:hypothetical protein